MSLSRYAEECQGLIEELRQSLSPEDVESLRRNLDTATPAYWSAWQIQNAGQISQFAASTPSQRKKRKAWADPHLHRQLVWAALLHLQRGQILLSAIASNSLEAGIGYRSMAAAAGDAYLQVRGKLPSAWPFAGAAPFVKTD